MDKLPSSEFRKTFASLTKPVAVTANGHVIGAWHPGVIDPSLQDLTDEVKHLKAELAKKVWAKMEATPGFKEQMAEAEAELAAGGGVLYKHIAPKPGGFSTRPFTPAPKKGK